MQRRLPLIVLAVSVACAMLAPSTAIAAPKTFLPAGTGTWSNPANWSDDAVPDVTDEVTIGAGSTVVLDMPSPQFASVTINGTLRVATSGSTPLSTSPITLGAGASFVVAADRTFGVSGNVTVGAGATITVENVSSRLNLQGGGRTLLLDGDAAIDGSGIVKTVTAGRDIDLATHELAIATGTTLETSGAAFTGTGSVVGSGTIMLAGNAFKTGSATTFGAGTTTRLTGATSLLGSAQVVVAGTIDLNGQTLGTSAPVSPSLTVAGTLKGGGTIALAIPVTITGTGRIVVPDAASTLTLNGTVTFAAGGDAAFDLEPATATSTIQFAGGLAQPLDVDRDVQVGGAGSVVVGAREVRLGTRTLDVTTSAKLTVAGGWLTEAGTLAGGGAITVSGSVFGDGSDTTIAAGATVTLGDVTRLVGDAHLAVDGTLALAGRTLDTAAPNDPRLEIDGTLVGPGAVAQAIDTTVHATGQVSVPGASAVLTMNGPVTLAGGADAVPAISVPESTSRVQFVGGAAQLVTVAGDVAFTGLGEVVVSGRELRLDDASVTLDDEFDLTLLLGGKLVDMDGGARVDGGRLALSGTPFGSSGTYVVGPGTHAVSSGIDLGGDANVTIDGHLDLANASRIGIAGVPAHTGVLTVGATGTIRVPVGSADIDARLDVRGTVGVVGASTLTLHATGSTIAGGATFATGTAASHISLTGQVVTANGDFAATGAGRLSVSHPSSAPGHGLVLGEHAVTVATATTLLLTGNGSLEGGGAVVGTGAVELNGIAVGGTGTYTFGPDVDVVVGSGGARFPSDAESRVVVAGTLDLNGAVFGPSTGASAARLVIDGALTNTRTDLPSGVDATAIINGTVKPAADADITFTNGLDASTFHDHVLRSGTWHLEGDSVVRLDGTSENVAAIDGAAVTLAGTAAIRRNGGTDRLAAGVDVTGGGRLTIAASRAWPSASIEAREDGLLVVADGAALDADVTVGPDGVVGGSGTIHGTLTGNGGAIRPGFDGVDDEVGRLTVDGDAALGAAELAVEVDPADVSDALDVTGELDLDEDSTVRLVTSGTVDPSYAFSASVIEFGTLADADDPTVHQLGALLVAPKEFVVRIDDDSVDAAVTERAAPTPPAASTSTPGAGTPTAATGVTLTLLGAADQAAGTGLSHYLVAWDQAPTTSAAGGTPTTGLPASVASPALGNGAWYAHVAAVDAAGNVSATHHMGPFVLDTVAPATPAIGGASSGSTTDTSANLTLSGEAGATFRCSLDGAAFAACASPHALNGLGLGTHTFRASAVDAAGNVSAAASVVWTVVAPAVADPTPNPPTPPVVPAVPVPPVKPAAGNIVFSGAAPRFAALGKAGIVKVRLPVGEARLKVTLQLQVNKAQAKALGLKLPRGRSTLVIGTGTVVSKKPGRLIVSVKLTAPAKAAFKRLSARTSRLKSAKVTLRVTLARGKVTSVVNKPLAFKK